MDPKGGKNQTKIRRACCTKSLNSKHTRVSCPTNWKVHKLLTETLATKNLMRKLQQEIALMIKGVSATRQALNKPLDKTATWNLNRTVGQFSWAQSASCVRLHGPTDCSTPGLPSITTSCTQDQNLRLMFISYPPPCVFIRLISSRDKMELVPAHDVNNFSFSFKTIKGHKLLPQMHCTGKKMLSFKRSSEFCILLYE